MKWQALALAVGGLLLLLDAMVVINVILTHLVVPLFDVVINPLIALPWWYPPGMNIPEP
jgi:hypothetical protein